MPVANATAKVALRVADAVWIATALLHQEHPARQDFSLKEIVDRVQSEPSLGTHKRATVYAHVTQHCVANVAPNSGKYRMLFETATGRRRLYRSGDAYDRRRQDSKTSPDVHQVPPKFADLIQTHRCQSDGTTRSIKQRLRDDPLMKLRGLGKEIWAGVDADEYVRQLREEWE